MDSGYILEVVATELANELGGLGKERHKGFCCMPASQFVGPPLLVDNQVVSPPLFSTHRGCQPTPTCTAES